MSLGLMMHANWDRMNSGQLQHYKTDRPVYSTPHPVQSTPANNECKLVELRGADVASFVIGDEEYICLPQVFDLFLKHLVGGLHTVYTKLKRLDITPVVCNVEQVRVLRGLGAIQPGVNRCKLITRKDFEALYRDCTTASRPGRPPKRYSIPSTSDLMSYHNEHQPANALRGMMNTTDVRNFHKRMRMEREASFDQHQSRRLSTSPTRRSPPAPDKYLSRAGAGDLYANAANIYLQQALRHQYQQFIANGIHNGVNFQHNPELAPFVGMAKTGFNGAMQPGFLSQLEEQRRKEMRHFSNETKNLSNDLNLHSTSGVDQRQENLSTSCSPLSQHGDKKTSNSPQHTRSSPAMKKRNDDNSFSREEKKHTPDLEHYPQTFFDDNNKTKSPKFSMNHDADQIETSANDKNSRCASDDEPPRSPPMDSNISSMQTLLSNIQGLLKVAADNAKFQEKQMSFELAEMRSRLEKEQELREETERRLEESRRMTASMQRKLDYERETRRRLQEQKLIAQDALTKGSTENNRSSPVGQRFLTVQATESSERKSPNLTSSNIHSSVKPTSSPELSPMSSSSCLVSPCSVDEYSSTRNSRCSVSAENDNGHRSNRSTPECNVDSPVNMTKEQKEWIPCDVAQ